MFRAHTSLPNASSSSQVLAESETAAQIQSLMACCSMLQVRDVGRRRELEECQEQVRRLTQQVAELKGSCKQPHFGEPTGCKRMKLEARSSLPIEHSPFAVLLDGSRQGPCSPSLSDKTDGMTGDLLDFDPLEFVDLLEHEKDGEVLTAGGLLCTEVFNVD